MTIAPPVAEEEKPSQHDPMHLCLGGVVIAFAIGILGKNGVTRDTVNYIIGFAVLALIMAALPSVARELLQRLRCRKVLREMRDHWEEWAPDCWPPTQETHECDRYPKLVKINSLNPDQPVLTLKVDPYPSVSVTNPYNLWIREGVQKLSEHLTAQQIVADNNIQLKFEKISATKDGHLFITLTLSITNETSN